MSSKVDTNIDIDAVPCGDISHKAVASNIDLEIHIRANCKIPKAGKHVKEGRYWVFETTHQAGAVEVGAVEAFHQAAVAAWKKGLYPKAAGVKGDFGVTGARDSSDFDDEWEMVWKKNAEDEQEVKSASGKHAHCLQFGLQ